ncbi:coiled-coil domain-containing protein 168 [Neomonachus schauinslandi]|uniref:Coiled-coil domain-containing protein 168 n=1 Tax=Neomonachus schauinslandi TaxID=29088 RepID=A0A2Y9HJ62_NEOSC|nr:coiled-coil domain-containing protein 168 [Neomonachus schauinslandi]
MSKQFYFFKKAVRNRLEDNTFWTLWELVESWTQNDWMAIFFIIFLGIIVEIILIKICTSFTKKPALPEKGSSSAQEAVLMSFVYYKNYPSKVDDFSERTITSSLTSEENEGDFEDRVSTADEVIWSSTSESKYQVSHFSESHMISSNGTSSSLSLFRSEVKEFSPSRGGYPENEHETVQFSSKKLFSIMKTNKNKNLVFSSDFNFSRSSRITTESEDLNVAPCPPAHLFLSRDQVRLLEENVRNQIALKSKTTLESKTTYLYSRLQESLIQNQHSVRMGISTQPQDSFPGQNAPQNQHFYETRYSSQAQQFVNNQESVNSQPDIMARYVALPQDLVRKPFSSSMQDSFQTQDMDRSQHLVNVSYSVETQDSVKGLESDKHFEQAQYSVWLKDSNKIKYLIRGQNAIFKNARFLVLMLSPNSFAEGVLQIKTVKPGGQKQIASSELSQYSVYGSGPLSPILKRQKNRRKKLPSKSKLSLKVPSQMSKKTPTLRVFQMTVCHTSKPSKFGYKYNAKKEELHQRCISEMALHLTYVSKLIPPYVKKYARKKLVKVMPGVTGCRHSLSSDAENVSYVGSIEKRGTSGSTKNKKQHGRENKGQKTISPKIPPQLEQSFMINTFQLKSPCSSLIEMTWKNKGSLKDPITQAKEIGIAEFCAPNSKKTSDLHIPKQESPLKEALSEPWQKFVSSPEVESNRRLKTQEDLKSTENSHLPLSSGEKLPTSSPEMQKCFPDGNTQKQKDFLEIVLETSEVNLLISLGIKEHESSEQLASVKTQDRTEDVILKEKKPLLTLHVTECDNLSESEGLECNTRSNIKNMQGKRIFATFHNATNTTISEPPDREMHSGLKGKTDTSTTGVSHSVVKLEKLPDEKKTWDVKYIEKRCIFKKSQEHDRGEEEQTFQEAVPELTQDFSLSLQLKQKPKYVRFEIKQSSSGSRKTQSKEQEVQPQTLPTETILGTSPCPPMDPFQIEVKQSRDRPTGRGAADPENPLPVLENPRVGEVLIETTECGVPFGGSPRKIPDDHITEEKADLQQVLPATALGSFIIYMLPLSHFKRQQIRKRLSGAKRVLSPKSIIMKVKKPTNLLMPHIRRHGTASLRKRLRGNFKILIKEMLQDKIVADVLVNVTYPHMSILPRIRTHGRLNAENHGQTKLKQEKSEDEREEKYSDSINKGSDSGNILEEVKLQDEVRGDKEAPPEAVLHDSWNLQLDANPEKELKAEEDIPQPITSMETLTESVYSSIMDLFHVETMKKSLTTQADLKCTADSETPLPTSETPLPTSEKSLAGDPPNQIRESDVLDYGSDAREMGYFSAETSSAELPKDLPATFPETFNCHMPILTHSKMNKNKVRFSSTEGSVKPRSVHTKTMKPSVSQVFNSTGQRKKLDSKYKAKLEKINQANGLVYEFINTLYSPMQSFCHAQLKQGELGEVRPRYVDFFDKSRAFHDREEKVEDGEEVEQKTLLEAAAQHTQYLWPDACQGKKTHLDEPDSALDCLTQELSVNEQDAQHQAWFVQTALQTGHQKGPREAEELKKTSETENDKTAPMGPKIPSPKAQNSLPPPENSRVFIFNAYQKENCDLVKSDEELKQPRSINIQVQPRIHGTQAILGSASCPMVDQFQFGKLESYARFSPPKSGEARMDEIIFSTREYGVPSDANHQKEQAGGIEKKDTVTFDFCIPALSTFKRKKHLKKYSDTKTLVNLKCGILKAKKPSVSYILSIKGGASPNHRKELEYNSTTKLEKMDQGEKMAAKMYSFMSITSDINRYSNTEREKGMLGERSLSSKQVKQALLPHQENITSDDTEENSLQDAEEERSEQETLKVIPQHSQHFKFCSGQREELELHQSENHGRGNILFVTEQGISQQMQRTDSMQGEKPKKSYQTQNGVIYTASSKLPLLKSKKSLIGQVLMDTMKGGVLSVGSHMGELYSHDKEENAEFKKDLQATVLESSDLGKSPCDGEVWKANSADPQNRSSNTMKMNVQHEREEENIKKMLSESVPHYNQHFSFSAHHMKNFGSYQSESELSDLEVRSTWNLSCAAQKMRQEKCFRETILEPVSRHIMNLLQVETEKKSLHQERIKCMGGLKTPFPKARKSETGSIQGGGLWGGNPRRKWDSYIFEKKAWNQNDLVRIVLKSSGFSSLDSCEPKSQSYPLEFVSKKSIINPKHVTLKAKKRSVSQLLNITGCITGSHRKMKGCKFQYKMKTRQWFEGVGEASLLAAEGTKIPPPKLVTDERSLDATARGTLYNRTLHRNLHGHITEEKAELWENSATTFLEPVDFFTPILSDSESQINTVRLLEEKITLNPRCLTLKEKEPAISQILKIRGRFTTKRRKKLGSNLKTKMQQMSQGKNVADTFPNTIYFTPDTYDIERQSRFKIGMDRVSRFSHVQPTQMQLPVEGLVISQPFNITGHAALSINEQQGKKIDRKREKTVLNVDLKFVYDSMPILSHLKMEPSPSTWDIYEESSGKRNALNKANASSAYAYIPMYPKIIKHKAKAKTAGVKNTMHIRRMKLKAKKPPVSQLFNTIGCGTRRNKKELRCDIKKQKEFQQDKTIADLFLNTVCDSGSLSSQIKQFTEVEREKSRPRKPINVPPQLELEKSLNKRKMSSSESTDIKSAFSRNIKTLKQCIREQKEKHQIVLLDLLPQCRDQLVISQHVKKELDHVKIGVALKREVYSGLASQKREINYTRFDIPRIRTHTECEFLVAPRVKHKDADVVKHSVSIPWGRGVSQKTNISLNSKGQNIFLTELDASHQKTHKEQEFQKQGSISLTIRGSFAYPIMEPPHLKNTGKVAEEDIYTNKRNISHLLRREDIKETDISQGSKGQRFLCTSLVGQQTMSAAQKGEVKPAGVPESIVDSVSRPNKEPLQVTQAVNTKKEDVSTSLSLRVNPGRKERSKLTDIPLRLNGQKLTSEKLGVKQLHSSNQNKENILESISSCMLYQFYNEKLKKKVSAKGMSSKVLSSVVDKALNEADTPVDQPSLSLHNRRRKEHQKESTCKVLPKSVSHSSMDVLQIKLPCVKKNIKGSNSKIPCEKKASEEVVSTVDYIPSTEKISSLITGKESKVHTGKGQSGMKLTSLCTSLPSLSQTNVNSRIKVGQDKSGIPRSCLPPLKLQVSPNVRKTSFAESINRGSLSNVRESKHLPQGKKEDGVYVKDIRGLKCVTFKGKKTPFEHTLHGKEPQWNNKEQEEMMQKDKSNLDIVQSKRHASIPSSPHAEWDPGIKEVLMRGITGFCLPSLTLQELSDTMGICEEPADDILSSIKKAKYMPQKDGVEMALEEIRHPKRIALKAKRTPIAHELQLNIKEKEKKMQEDKDKPVGIRSKSCVSISFPPYSEVDTRIKGEEALLIKTRPSFLQTELQESSDRGKIAYKQSIHGETSNSVEESKEHYIMQEEEEKVKMVKVILLRKKRSPILQEIQLDIKEQEEKTQKIKGEPNVLVTNTSTCIPAPSHLQLDTRIKKADYVTEVTRSSLPELSQQKSLDAVKKANKSTDGDITSDVQEAKEHTPQKEETNVEKSAKRDMMHPKDKDLKRKEALLQDIPLNLKEQVKEDPEGEEQGKVDRGGKGEQEVVLPTNWASESLTHHELNTRIGEEDRQEITGSAVSQLQLRKSSHAGKMVYTKSAGDDISNDVRVIQEYEPQEGEDRRKIVNIKYIMYPKGTTSKAKVLPPPHVLCISGGCDAQIREVQTSIKEKLRYIQERSELGKVLTRPSLPQFKLNKSIEGKEEKQVSRPFLLPSWPRESSNAEKLKHTVLPLNDTSNDSKRTKYMTQKEEDKANTFEKDITHSTYIALRAKKSPLSLIVKTKKLQVNIKEQVKVGQEDNKETVVLPHKIHPFLISSTHLKWNTIKDEEGEPGIIINDAPHLELQESLPSGQLASTDSPDSHVKKGDPRPRQAERNGVQTGAMNGSVQPQGTDFKAKTSPPSHTFSVTEHGALNQRKEPQWHMKEKVEQEQQRTGDPDVAPTKTSSTPSPSYHRLDTRTKVDKDLLAVTGFSPSQLLCSKSSGAGKIRYADSNESIRSCNVIIKAYQSMPYTEVKDRVKIKGGKDRRFPQIITSTAETSPLRHLPSRKRLPLNIKEQGKEVPEGKSEPEMVLKETCAALPSPSYLKWDTRMNEKEDTLRITQSYFPPPKIQDPSSSGKKPYTKSFDGCVLKEKDRLKTDLENKMVPIPMALKAKELPLSRILDTKKLQWKIKEQERKVQKDENDLATHLENICTSLLTLPYLKFGSREGEGYMIRITELPLLHLQSKESPGAVKTTYAETTDGELSNDVKKLKEHTLLKEVRDREKKVDMNSMVDPNDRYLKAKKSPNLLRYNLSALRWKTKKQEGTAQEGQREPGGAVLTKTCTCRSPLLHFNTNTRVEEKRIPILTRSSFPTVSSQESSDSEDMECIEPITSDILISPQKGKYHMPQNKEKDGVEIVNLMFPKHQEKKMQESEDEPSVVVANSSSPLPSLPHLQLDKETQVGDEMLGPARSVVQRESNAGEVVHTEAIHGDVMKDSQNKKQLVPQEEEQYRKKTIDRRNMTHTTDISLKSRKSPPLLMLHRTELHLNIGGQEQKKDECPGKPAGTVLRKIYVSKPPAEITLDKGIQVDEERLRIKRLSLIPQMLSAVSDTKMRADTGAICDIRERKQHMSQKEKKHEVKTVDMRIRMHHKEARISSISHIFNTKEFVLNIKELKENVYKGKDELPVVLTRTFLSVPSAPSLYLDSGSKVDKDVPGLTGSSPPQQNLQESSDTQKTAIREVVAGDGEIVKKAGHSVHQEKAVQQWTSNFMISVQRRNEPPRVKSEGDLSQLVLNSQHENIYLTGFGTISGKRLEYFFTGQEVQPEKYKTETFTTFLSYPTMEPTKIGNLKKQTEIMDNLNHKISPKVLVTPPRKISKKMYITFGAPISAKGFSVSEQDAHQQKTLSKASPGSADSYKFDKPAKDVHNNDKVSKMLSPEVLAPQTEGSLEKMNIAESDTSPIIEEQEIVVKKQVVLQSESGHKTWLDSSFSLKFPLQNGRQKTPLETDVHKQTIVYPRIQILPGIHMDITVFDTIGGKKEQGLPVPQQEEYILESLQKSLSSHWTFPLQSGDLEGKNKMDTSTTINLEQKTLEMEEGELKIDTNIAIRLAADKTEMHKHTMVNLEENKKRDTSNTVNLNIPSLKAQIPQINTQLITHRANSCPIKQKHKKELEVSGAKQNIQPQKLFQKHVLDSFYAYIPLSLKFKGWKGRLTVADLKRELSPKYLTMKIPNHPVSQILNNMGHGTPSNRKKLEYDLKKPKKTVLRSEDASGIFVRSLSISTVSSSQIEEIVDSETNRGREKILCPSEFQQKSPHTQENSLSTVKEGDQNFTDTAPEDSQPSVVEEQQMQKLPSVKSEANLGSETKEKNLIPQTKEERVVPGHDSSRIIKESDLRMTEEEGKAPKPLLTPAEGPLMSDEPKDNCISPPRWGDQSEPVQATTAQNVQHQKPFPGTGPIPSQVKSNEIKVVAGSTSTESLLPLFEAIKNIFESQIKNMIYDNICEDILKKVKAPKPDDWKLPPRAGSPDTTCTTVPPEVQPKPILERFTPKENNKLTNHFESKAFEIKLNLIPEMAKQSFQKFSFYLNQSFSEDNSWRLYPRHKKMCFLSLKGIDTVELHLKQKCAQDSPPVSCMKTLIVSVSRDSEEITTKLRRISKLESGVSSVTSAKQMPCPHILQNYSVEEKDKLLIHFSMKTLEIHMKAFPRIVRESCAMGSPQNIRKPLSKCIHSGFKVPKRKNRILLLFEEKSLHQIDLDLQYKYLHFLLGLPVGSVFPKPTALPKHILKLNTVAICENIDNRGESGGDLCIDMELLEQHISFKNQSPHENSSLRKFWEPTLVCASDPSQQGPVQKDTTALSELKSHTTLEKDKQCHVWFQETDICKSFDSKTQESTPSLVDSHSTQISEDFTESQTNIKSSANLEECSALEAHESEECMFLEANPYLSQESQNILFELQKGIPLENLYTMKKSKTNLKPLYREDSGSQHIRACRKHSSIVTPSYESHKSGKYRSSSKMPSPDWLRGHGSLNAVEVLSRSSSIPFSEEKSLWTARCRTNHSLAPLTESNIKLHLAKGQGKPHRHLESKEGKKAKSDLFRKNNIHWDCDYSYTWTKEKCTRKKKVRNCESERSNYFSSKPKLPSKLHQEDINFHSERKQNQPFFYACIPADSLEIMPQTIRWTIPPRTLRKTNFRVPLVAKISSSFNIWTSSKKFLESLLESFSPVHQNRY